MDRGQRMKTFSQYLNEMPRFIFHYPKRKHQMDRETINLETQFPRDARLVGNIGAYLVFYRSHTFYVIDDDKVIHLKVLGTLHNKVFIIDELTSWEDNQVRAVDFYKHLILRQGLVLASGEELSKGGLYVWNKLAQDSAIKVLRPSEFSNTPVLTKSINQSQLRFMPERLIAYDSNLSVKQVKAIIRDSRLYTGDFGYQDSQSDDWLKS